MAPDSGSALLGKWVTDPDDQGSLRRFGRVTLEFTCDGWLIYTGVAADREQEILLTYRVQGSVITTDQPDALREERTRFAVTPDGKLILIRDRMRCCYVRL